jgi:hypothetical protein
LCRAQAIRRGGTLVMHDRDDDVECTSTPDTCVLSKVDAMIGLDGAAAWVAAVTFLKCHC